MRRVLRARRRKVVSFFIFPRAIYITASVAILLLLAPLIPVGSVTVDGVVKALAVFSKLNVTLMYVHSVELYRVVEEYALTSCGIELVELEWAGFGAGMPSALGDLVTEDIEWRSHGGAISKVNVKLRESVAVDAKYMLDPRLFIDGREVGIRERMVLRVCHRVSLLELAVRYIELVLLGGFVASSS